MFRFSIRDILLLTITVAMICGWVAEHSRARSLSAKLKIADEQIAHQTSEIQRLHRVNEITADQWAKALGSKLSPRP